VTFWGKPERTKRTKHGEFACTWLSSRCDWDLRPQHITHQKYITHAQYRNGDSGYSSVKQSNMYVTHGLYRCKTHRIWCSLHQDNMDRWSTFTVLINMR